METLSAGSQILQDANLLPKLPRSYKFTRTFACVFNMNEPSSDPVHHGLHESAGILWSVYSVRQQVDAQCVKLSKIISPDLVQPRYCLECEAREGRGLTIELLDNLSTLATWLECCIRDMMVTDSALNDFKGTWKYLLDSNPEDDTAPDVGSSPSENVGSLRSALCCFKTRGDAATEEQMQARNTCSAVHVDALVIWSDLRETYVRFYGVVSFFASAKDFNDLCAIPALLFSEASGVMIGGESLISRWSTADLSRMSKHLTLELSTRCPDTPETNTRRSSFASPNDSHHSDETNTP